MAPNNEYISEVHVVAQAGKHSLNMKRIGTKMYSVNLSLPQYALHRIDNMAHTLKFVFYKLKTDTEPYMVARFCYATWLDDDKTIANCVVQKTDVTERNICTAYHTRWQNYELPVKIYTSLTSPRPIGRYCLETKRIDELLRTIMSVSNNVMADAHMYCQEELDELAKLYDYNIRMFVDAARFRGVKRIYINTNALIIENPLPSLHDSFNSWLSNFTDMLGNRHTSSGRQNGLITSGGNSRQLSLANSTCAFPAEWYDKVIIIPPSGYQVNAVWPSKEITEQIRRNGQVFRSRNYNAIPYRVKRYVKLTEDHARFRARRMHGTPDIPGAAIALYSKYLAVRTAFFKKVCKHLYSLNYRISVAKWEDSYEVLMFANSDYTNIGSIRFDERSNEIPGPWITPLREASMLQVNTNDELLTELIRNTMYNDTSTCIDVMLDLLTEMRFEATVGDVFKAIANSA